VRQNALELGFHGAPSGTGRLDGDFDGASVS